MVPKGHSSPSSVTLITAVFSAGEQLPTAGLAISSYSSPILLDLFAHCVFIPEFISVLLPPQSAHVALSATCSVTPREITAEYSQDSPNLRRPAPVTSARQSLSLSSRVPGHTPSVLGIVLGLERPPGHVPVL